MAFKKAVKYGKKLRMALIGPAGGGKTYTALAIAKHLAEGGRVAVVDTEHGSASVYSDVFDFDVLELSSFSPERYIEAIRDAERAGYSVVILDSLSHAWTGTDGALEQVDRAKQKFTDGWRTVTPIHNRMIDTILGAKLHVIATMRSKMAYVVETNERTGKAEPKRVGMQPIQREGMEYEFDVVADLDLENNLHIGKTRCSLLTGKSFNRAGKDVVDILSTWLQGQPAPDQPAPAQPATNGNGNGKQAADGTGEVPDINKLRTELKQLRDKEKSYGGSPPPMTTREVNALTAVQLRNLIDGQRRRVEALEPPQQAAQQAAQEQPTGG